MGIRVDEQTENAVRCTSGCRDGRPCAASNWVMGKSDSSLEASETVDMDGSAERGESQSTRTTREGQSHEMIGKSIFPISISIHNQTS